MYNDTNNGQQQKARRIIRKALALNLVVSAFDGEAWAVKRSSDFNAIWEAIGNTDKDELVFRTAHQSKFWMLLVWGNASDGSELVSNYTVSDLMESLAAA